jgi:hypothetical protein
MFALVPDGEGRNSDVLQEQRLMELESLVRLFGQIESKVGLHRLRKLLNEGGNQLVHYFGHFATNGRLRVMWLGGTPEL